MKCAQIRLKCHIIGKLLITTQNALIQSAMACTRAFISFSSVHRSVHRQVHQRLELYEILYNLMVYRLVYFIRKTLICQAQTPVYQGLTNHITGHTGFEPVHDGTRNRCLTAWLMPKINFYIIQHTLYRFQVQKENDQVPSNLVVFVLTLV